MFEETLQEKLENKFYQEYFELFKEKAGINLLCNKSTTVNKMIIDNQIDLMYYWYQKTGYKFIPDYVVMQNFPKEEIDKFLENGKIWSHLMKIKEYSEVYEGREVLLKLAYIYGVFSNDNNSINHLEYLLKGIPQALNKEELELLIKVENILIKASNLDLIFPTKDEINMYNSLKEQLIKEHLIPKETEYILEYLYKTNDNKKYILQINWQQHQELVLKIRKFMEIWGIERILTPFKAYQIFSKFKMEYDKEFKDFLIENMDIIISNYEYSKYLPKIQSEFKEIKKLNSNRKLTLDLALNYVKEDNYDNVNTGNEKLSSVISKIGLYNQKDFETLQKIYNYGKLRTFSSIPRIKRKLDNYSYEILKLDDPLAITIGVVVDCCQKLNDSAEMCMEHSMVDPHGRIFVVRDKEGQIVAQSWMWRNKNTICFDDIEIPNRLLTITERKNGPLARYELVTEILEVYKEASNELLKIDNMTYQTLLENNLITKEVYDNLKLNKVTVGLGYNDIASVIRKKLKYDGLVPTRPYTFDPLVKLKFYLYLNDSSSQYILASNNKISNKIDYSPLIIYNDEYDINLIKDITYEDLRILNSLIRVTDNITYDYNIKDLTIKYNTYEENIKTIIHPNFVVLYKETELNNIILDIFLNTKIDNKEQQLDITNTVLLQIKLALIQISKNNKKIDISKLTMDKIDIFNNINSNINIDKTKIKILKK